MTVFFTYNQNMSGDILENYKEHLDIWYKTNNIIMERSELYCDFLVYLTRLIDETFLGSDVIESSEDLFNHFTWCFNKISADFEKERIVFTDKGDHYKYLWFFFYGSYYSSDQEQKTIKIENYFKSLFDYEYIKNEMEIKAFIDLYKIFDQNLKK